VDGQTVKLELSEWTTVNYFGKLITLIKVVLLPSVSLLAANLFVRVVWKVTFEYSRFGLEN